MNILFLRGKADRKGEIAYRSIEKETDMWTELAYAMTGEEDSCKVLYWGGHRKVYYKDNFCIEWVEDLNCYRGKTPDVIIARGGFEEYKPVLSKYKCKKVYYGAGKRYKPDSKYDLVLADSKEQLRKLRKEGFNAELFFKPASHIFQPIDNEKKYDIGFVALIPTDKRKNVSWVYKTNPGLKILQMGLKPDGAPSNVKVKHVIREKMPRLISQCKVIIAPYRKEDSCPRIIPEALACGIPVVAMETVRLWEDIYCMPGGAYKVPKVAFWETVEWLIESGSRVIKTTDYYKRHCSIDRAAEHLKGLLKCL